MNKLRYIAIGLTFFIVIAMFSSKIPEPIDDARIAQIAKEVDLPEEYVRDNLQFNIADPEIDKLNSTNVKITTPKEIVAPIEVKPPVELQLERIITFDDGTKDTKIISKTPLLSLDFLAVKDNLKPINNGKISLKLSTKVEKPVVSSEGKFVLFVGDKQLKTISPSIIQGKNVLFDEIIDVNSVFSSLSPGTHKLELRLVKFFIVFDDYSRLYAEPEKTIYSVEFEKSDAYYLKKNEQGNYDKVFDSDAKISITANSSSYQQQYCASSNRGGGCAYYYTQTVPINAPSMGLITIYDSQGTIVAQGNSISFNAQRGQTYKITVTDPAKTWSITIPTTGGNFVYSCHENVVESYKTNILGGNYPVYTNTGRTCNF